VGPAWDRALAAERPVVLQARVDPDVPMLPPHVSREQAMHFARAILKGDPDAWGVIKQTVREATAGKP
jgi:pyruvate dehydrogenase (quinone)